MTHSRHIIYPALLLFACLAILFSTTVAHAAPSEVGEGWTLRTDDGGGGRSVTYGNGLFVVVRGEGAMTSPDGITWTTLANIANNSWQSVTYGNGLFVAVACRVNAPNDCVTSVGPSNRVMTSPDGITWTLQTVPESNEWRSVTYGNGIFVAVAQSGTGNRVMTSPDGITWTIRTSAADNSWQSVTYGNGLFVAVSTSGIGNRVMTSPDGITWTSRASAADNQWLSVTYGNGLFVAVSSDGTNNRVMTSPDGITWVTQTSAANHTWQAVTYGNGLFVATACRVNSTACTVVAGPDNRIMTSPDGITWTIATAPEGNHWNSSTYGNDRFVVVASAGSSNRVMTFAPAYVTADEKSLTAHYITPADVDYHSTIVLVSTSTITDVPVNGVTYTVGDSIGTSTVGCLDTAGISSTSSSCTTNDLTRGETYHVKIFTRDDVGDYSVLGVVPSGSPVTAEITTSIVLGPAVPSTTIYPGGGVATSSSFGLVTSTSTDTITALHVRLGNDGHEGIALLEVVSEDGGTVYAATTTPTSSSFILPLDSSITVTTATSTYYIRITPKTHTNMPAPPGGEYRIVTRVIDWTGAGNRGGVDVATTTIIIDNGSPANVSDLGITRGTQQLTVGYRTPVDTDFHSTLVLIGTELITATPTEGALYTVNDTIGDATVACVDATTPDTGRECLIEGLTNGTLYHIKTFTRDEAGNYSVGSIPATSPARPNYFTTIAAGPPPSAATRGPGGASATSSTFELTTSSSTDTVTGIEVTFVNGGSEGVALLEVLNHDGSVVHGSVANPGSSVVSVSLGTTIVATTTPSLYQIRVTPKSHANMPAPPGAEYVITTRVSTWTQFNVPAGTDTSSSTVTIDNRSPAEHDAWIGGVDVPSPAWRSVTYGNGLFVAVAQSGTNSVMTSSDGITWTSQTSAADNVWNSVTYGNGLFVAVSVTGTGNRVMTSPDGITWTIRTSIPNNAWTSVTYGNGLFVAVACGVNATACNSTAGNRVMTSPNGVDWTTQTTPADNQWMSVTYGNGIFVAVAQSGTGNRVMTSPDGITWTSRTSAADNAWYGVTYGNGLFVAVAGSGTNNRVMTSPDGITWTIRTSAADHFWHGVTYANGLFVAVSVYLSGNVVMTSPDGITWTSRMSAADSEWRSVAYSNGLFVAVSHYGLRAMYSRGITMTPGNRSVTLTYRTPADADYHSTVILRSTTPITATPTEGVTYTVEQSIGNATVACIDTAGVAATTSSCVAEGLTNGTTYHFAAFARDNEGNYSLPTIPLGGSVRVGPGTTIATGSILPDITIYPGASSTDAGTFTLVTEAGSGAGSDTITALEVVPSPTILDAHESIALVEIVSDNGEVVYGSATNPAGNTVSVPLITPITVTTTLTQYRIRITPKSHADMQPAPGKEYSLNPYVSGWTGGYTKVGNDKPTRVILIDNKGPTATDHLWNTHATPLQYQWQDVAYGNGRFVATGADASNNAVISSDDGQSWITRYTRGDRNFRSVTYGNGLFVTISRNTNTTGTFSDIVLTSSDGISWTGRTAPARRWRSVTYGNGMFVAVNSNSPGERVMTSNNGIDWVMQSTPADHSWYSVTYGNGLFVAVACGVGSTDSCNTTAGNRIMTSPDGIEWTLQESISTNQWHSITYGNGLFVAVAWSGSGNRVMTSPDGITWTSQTGISDNNWYSVTYGNGLFVAVAGSGTGNRVMTSPDGIEWTIRTSPMNNLWQSVTYGNGLFVAVACGVNSTSCNYTTGNRVMTWYPSTLTPGDGEVTASYDTPPDLDYHSTIALVSTSTPVVDAPAEGVTYSVGDSVGSATVGCIDTAGIPSATSTCVIENLVNDTEYHVTLFTRDVAGNYSLGSVPINSPVRPGSLTITIDNGTPVPNTTTYPGESATTSSTFTLTTDTGAGEVTAFTLNLGTNVYPGLTLVEVTSNDELTVYGTTTPTTDTPTITLTTPITASTTPTQYRIRVTPKSHADMPEPPGGEYLIQARITGWTGEGKVGGVHTALTTVTVDNRVSTLDIWTTRESAADNSWQSVTYGNGLFVAVSITGTSNRVMTSPDGITWTSRTSAADNAWYGVTYGNGLFVAVSTTGTGNRVMTSPDGITWTSRTSAADNSWWSVTYGNGLFVAVAVSGTGNRVMTSPDGITWTSRTSAADNSWWSVTYGNGLFVAVSSTGTGNRVMTSPDGITWTARTSAADNDWRSVTYGNGLFVAVSSTGTGNRVMTSPDGITWTARTSAADNSWWSITYGNGLFVAVSITGTNNRVMTSPDGITWTSQTSAADNLWRGVTYGNGLFVAVSSTGTGNRVMTWYPSTLTPGDGEVTASYDTPPDLDYHSTIALVSTSTPVVDAPAEGVTYSVGDSVGSATVGCIDTAGIPSATSTCVIENLVNDTEYHVTLFTRDVAGNYSLGSVPINSPVRPGSLTITIDNGTPVPNTTTYPGESATTSSTFTLTTDTGAGEVTAFTLNLGTNVYPGLTLVEVTSNDELTVYGTTTPTTDTPTITLTTPITASTTPTQYRIRVTPKSHADMPEPPGGEYLIQARITGWTGEGKVGGVHTALTTVTVDNRVSTLDIWTTRESAADNSWQSVTYGNGLFVAVSITGTSNRVMTSPDGITWTSRESAADNNWFSVTYGNGLFVAVGFDTSLWRARTMTSPDGVTWSLHTYDYIADWTTVTYGNGRFVAVADCGDSGGACVGYSFDGVEWVTLGFGDFSSGVGGYERWRSVTYGNGLFVAVARTDYGSGVRVMTSPDGITWTARTSAADNSWWSVTYGNGLFVAVAVSGTGNRVMTSPDGITWTSRESAADNAWYGVTYGNGLFVAVACGVNSTFCNTTAGNRVMTSPDGITWTARTSAADNSWWSVTYGNGLFVAVAVSGTGNRVMTWYPSTLTPGDGEVTASYDTPPDLDYHSTIALVSTSTPVVDAPAEGVTYSVGDSVGSATVGCIDTAGIPSATSTCVIENLVNDTEYHVTLFTRDVAGNYSLGSVPINSPVRPGSLTITIDNGTPVPNTTTYPGESATTSSTFTLTTDTGAGEVTAFTLNLGTNVYPGLTLVEVTSNDELTVYGTTTPTTDTPTITLTTPITASTTPTQYRIRVTPKSHADMPEPPGGEYLIQARITGWTGEGKVGGVHTALTTVTVDNRVSTLDIWTTRESAADNSWQSVTYGNGLFVAVSITGTSNRVMTSPDGITWTSRESAADNNWFSVTYGNGLFVAVACGVNSTFCNTTAGNRVMTSPDGITWTSRTSAADNSWRSVTYGNGLFVAVSSTGSGNRVMTSPDGITWTSRTSAADNSWWSVTYGNGLFVAVACGVNSTFCNTTAGNRVMTSPDGITWTSRTSAADNSWSSVTYGNGLFVAVSSTGSGNRVMTSPDGITWTSRTSAANNGWTSVTYGNGLFVAVSSTGIGNRVMTSPDGITWTSRTSAANNGWTSVTYGNGLFVAVASSGTGNRVMTWYPSTLTPGDDEIIASYDTPPDLDYHSTIVLISTSTPVVDVPIEGVTYTVGDSVGSATVGCIDTTGIPSATSTCVIENLVNDTEYHVTLFTRDVAGNYSLGWVPADSPLTLFGATRGPELASLTDDIFYVGQATSSISTLTLLHATTSPEITLGNDIRITVPEGENFRFDTGMISPTFGGSAANKVGEVALYADGGSTLIIPVRADFAPGDTLTIDGVRLGTFAQVSEGPARLALHTKGSVGEVPATTSKRSITVGGTITAGEHPQGQVPNQFQFLNSSDIPIFAFSLTPAHEHATMENLSLRLSRLNNVDASRIQSIRLYRDVDDSRTLSAGDTLVATGTISVQGGVGAITFADEFDVTETSSYVVIANLSGVNYANTMIIDLRPVGMRGRGVTSGANPMASFGLLTAANHSKGRVMVFAGDQDGGEGAIGGPAPVAIVRSGGGSSGGSGAVTSPPDPEEEGETIGDDVNYKAPTSSGTVHNEWHSGANALVSNNTYATTSAEGARQTYSVFSFSVPSGNTVGGITVKLEASATSSAGGTFEVALSSDGGTTFSDTRTTGALTTTDKVYTLGSQSDLWDRSWTPLHFTNDVFMIRVTAHPDSNTLRLDAVQVWVYSVTGGGGSGGGSGAV
jgi:tetrahydromethanopterin S-methyltransferase subunit F